MKTSNKVIFVGPFTEHAGYSYMNRRFVSGLCLNGWDMGVENMKCNFEVSPKDYEFFKSLNSKGSKPYFYDMDEGAPSKLIKIVCWLPLPNIPRYKHNVSYTMMETKEVSPSMAQMINLFYQSIWVPTEYYKRAFEDAGSKIPVDVVPVGIDESFVQGNVIKDPLLNYKSFRKGDNPCPEKPSGFVFLSLFRWTHRKGFDVLLKSFLKEFNESDGVSLVIVSRHVASTFDPKVYDAVENDIRRFVEKYGSEKSAPIYWCSDNIPSIMMPSVYAVGDVFVIPSRGEGVCTFPTAKIKTPNGIKEIQHIEKGDEVFTHRGSVSKVVETFRRKNNRGKMVEISAYGRDDQKLSLTGNHKVRVVVPSESSIRDVSKWLKNCLYDFERDSLVYYYEKDSRYKNRDRNFNLKWIKAKDVKKGDFLFYPPMKYNEIQYEIDLSKIDSISKKNEIKDGKIYKTCGNQIGKFEHHDILFGSTKIKLTKGIMRLFGYCLSEGSFDIGDDIFFSININECIIFKDIKKISMVEFGVEVIRYDLKDKKSRNVCLHSSVVSDLFRSMFGYDAENKTFPNYFFNLDTELKVELLKGMFRWDGYYGKYEIPSVECKACYSTVSEDLANRIFDLLQQLGISSSIEKRGRNNAESCEYGNVNYSVIFTKVSDYNKLLSLFNEDVNIFKSLRKNIIGEKGKDFQLLKVRNVKEIDYDGDVYNIGVDGDNSYICENIAVHNCLPALEASKMGLPLISPEHTGFSDYVKQDNSYIIDVDKWVYCNEEPDWSGWVTNQFFGQLFPKFGDSVVEQTSSHMRYVMNHMEEAKEKNKRLKKVIEEKYTWGKSILAAEERLFDICQ